MILPYPLTNFEIQKYYQNEHNFNGVYSRNNLSKIKDEAYVINLDDYESTGTHWIVLYVKTSNDSMLKYFDSLGVEHISKEIKQLIGNRNITANIFRKQRYDLIMFRYVCIEFIDFVLKGKSWLVCYFLLERFFSYEIKDKVILRHFK